MALHTCPVCGNAHEIHAILDQLSYRRQRTCSPQCKAIFPRLVRARVLAEIAGSMLKKQGTAHVRSTS